MRLMDEAKCHICKRIFCCAKCRQKHQFDTHAIAVKQRKMDGDDMVKDAATDVITPTTIYVFCPICEQKPLTLREEMYAELLSHIESVHLPLRCRKCLRQYTKIDDLLEFSKCVDLGQNCSSGSLDQNRTCDTDASKVTVKKATVPAAITISTQTSPSIAKDLNETQYQQQQQHSHLTPISLFNLRWKAKSRLTHEEFSVSSIRNLSSESVNLSDQQRRSIEQLAVPPDTVHQQQGTIGTKVIRSTSTPLQVCSVFAKPKETLTFNATGIGGSGSGHMSSIHLSGFESTPAATSDNNNQVQQPQQRPWKVAGRGKMSAVTPLRQVMSKSIQKAFVEHGVGMLTTQHAGQRRVRLDLSENNTADPGLALDLRLSPVVRRTQSEASVEEHREMGSTSTEAYQILLSAQKLTTESIIITRTQHGSRSNSLPVSTTNGSTTSTVYNSCESVEIITSSSSTAEMSTNIQQSNSNCIAQVTGSAVEMPPITPITRIPGAVINKKLIKFETPLKIEAPTTQIDGDESVQEKDVFYTPNPSSSPITDPVEATNKERRRQQIIPRQLSGEFSPNKIRPPVQRPQGPRARPPLRACYNQKAFSCVQDVESDEEVFLPNSASTHNDKKCTTTSSVSQSEPGRLWSLMSSVMRLPATLRSDRTADKENTSSTSGSLIRRCASIAGSLVRTMNTHDDPDMQSMKRKRTQTLDNQYSIHTSPAGSSKRLRIQPRKPIERMRNNY
ncbi:hypothetical protein ACLKA7_001652 [Drosophila subpalustris]